MQASTLILLALVGVASAHFGGGHGGPFGELFKNLTEAQKQELKSILHNQDLTRAQVKQQVSDWVAKQGDDVKKAFEEAEKKKQEHKAKHQEEHAKKIANYSPEAKAVDEQISAVFHNENLTKKQVCEQINEIVGKATDAVKTEMHLEARDCSKPFQHGGRPGKGRHGRHQQQAQKA